jgi:hypothetical protein
MLTFYEYPYAYLKIQLGLSGHLTQTWGIVSFLTPRPQAVLLFLTFCNKPRSAAASGAATGRFIVLYFERRSLRARELLLSFGRS